MADVLAALAATTSSAHPSPGAAVEALGKLALSGLASVDAGSSDSQLLQFAVGDAAEGSAEAAAAIRPVFRELKRLYADALAHNATEAKFGKALMRLGLAESVAASLTAALRSDRAATVSSVRANAAAAVGTHVLKDFDWSVQHVVASDKLHSMGESLVSLTLSIDSSSSDASGSSGATAAPVTVEMSSAELDAVIGSLEQALAVRSGSGAVAAAAGGAAAGGSGTGAGAGAGAGSPVAAARRAFGSR